MSERERNSAEVRARALLRSWLTPEQRATLAAADGFVVRGHVLIARHPFFAFDPFGGTAYGWYPEGAAWLPPSDVLLATALAIEAPGGLERMAQQACRRARNYGPFAGLWAHADRVARVAALRG